VDTLLPFGVIASAIRPVQEVHLQGKVIASGRNGADVTRPAETDALRLLRPSRVRDRLTEAIGTLRGAERLVVTFYYYEELTTEEVAFLLDRTASSVRQIHDSAISQLLTKLQL
jgi:RNA polymerase sigma factor (sigma-70 family)